MSKIKVDYTVELTDEQLLKLYNQACISGHSFDVKGLPTAREMLKVVRRYLIASGKDKLDYLNDD